MSTTGTDEVGMVGAERVGAGSRESAPAKAGMGGGVPSIIYFCAGLVTTTFLLMVCLSEDVHLVNLGIAFFLVSLGLSVAGTVSGIRSYRKRDDIYRAGFGIAFNVTMLFSLLVMAATAVVLVMVERAGQGG